MLHLLERILDVVQRDALADEPLEVEPALEVEVHEQREVTAMEDERRYAHVGKNMAEGLPV